MHRRAALAALVVTVVAGAAVPMAAAAPTLYVQAGSQTFSVFASGANGALSLLPAPANGITGAAPQGTAISPNGESLYVANRDADSVSQLDLGTGGAVATKAPATVPAGDEPLAVAVHPDGDSVYVANSLANTVSQYSADADGDLAAKTPATVASGTGPESIALSPDGANAYVADRGANTVSIYDVAADGSLTARRTVPATPPTHVVVSPDGANVYVASPGGGIQAFTRAPDGSLTSVGAPSATAPGISGLALSPDGESLYAAIASSVEILQFDVGAGGQLAPKTTPSFTPAGTPSSSIAIHPDGDSAYASIGPANQVQQLDIGAGGALASKTPATVASETAPRSIALTPEADLAVTQTASPQPVGVGAAVDYTITVTNREGVPATGVQVTDTLPADQALVSATSSRGSCDSAGTCSIGTLEQGDSATVTISARALRSGTFMNTATADAIQQDPDTTNNSGSATSTVDDRPGVTSTPASAVAQAAATMNGVVTPGGRPTTYRFEWGTTTAYGNVAAGDAGSGAAGTAVSAAIGGLASGTTYHYRLVATNAVGTAASADQTFTTAAAAASSGGGSSGGGAAPANPGTPAVTPKKADRSAPRLSRLALTATSLRFRLPEAGSVRATIERRVVRRVRRGGRVRRVSSWKVAKRVRASSKRAATVTVRLRKLPAGTYGITLRATDMAGNAAKPVKVTRKLRARPRRP